MKNLIYIFIILILAVPHQIYAEKVNKEKAEKIARNWMENKLDKSKSIKIKYSSFIYENDTMINVFNFGDDGFILIPTDDNTYPILGYSAISSIKIDNLLPDQISFLRYYSEMINFNKSQKEKKNIKNKWFELEQGISMKSSKGSVSSLFESTSSSSWAGWKPYQNQAPSSPYDEGTNGCVPGRLAELMKYHKYPRIGTGSNSYSWNGTTISENFNKIFSYDDMPYELTYCGNGLPTCNDGSFEVRPDVTQENIDEVGWLQYLAGVAVEMEWLGDRGHPDSVRTGTDGNTGDWVGDLATYFNYSTDFDYWSTTRIASNTSDFKDKARDNLDDGLPFLFRYRTKSGGHLTCIDGYENDEFFHIIFGWRGFMNGYYYLFASDNDLIHDPRPAITLGGLNATFDIHPNCPTQTNSTISGVTIGVSDGSLLEAIDNITISNSTVIGNGSDGGRLVLRAENSVIISSNFNVQLGAQFAIFVEPCGK